jgi:hypothetical protein
MIMPITLVVGASEPRGAEASRVKNVLKMVGSTCEPDAMQSRIQPCFKVWCRFTNLDLPLISH